MNRQYVALSGIAIVLIALNHAVHFGLQISPVEGGWLRLLIFLQALGGFAVPIFLFISGAFLSYAASALSFTFVKSNVGRILWPYVIWSLVFYAWLFLSGGARYSPQGYVKNLLVGYPYHFVPLLVFWYVSAPILSRLGKRYGVAVLTAIGLYQVVLLTLRYPDVAGLSGPFPRWSEYLKPPVLFSSMSIWSIYFPLGLVLSAHDRTVRPHLIRLRGLFLAVLAAVFLIGILNAYEVVSAPWARFAAPLPLMFLLPTIDRGSIPFVRRFEMLGKRTYGVYLAHFVLINIAVVAISKWIPALSGLPVIVYPAAFVIALGGSLLLMDLTARTLQGRRMYRYVFGVAPPAPDVRPRPNVASRPVAGVIPRRPDSSLGAK